MSARKPYVAPKLTRLAPSDPRAVTLAVKLDRHEWYRFADDDRVMLRCENCGVEKGAGSNPRDTLTGCPPPRPEDAP